MSEPNNPAQIRSKFADGDHTFAMTFNLAAQWEDENGKSLFRTYRRMLDGEFGLRDIREVLRLALIGGGKKPAEALKLVETYVEGQPLGEYQELSLMILHAAFYGESLMDDMALAKVEGEVAA